MSAQFLSDPKVERLGETHGPAGPLVIVALLGHAQLQEAGGRVERTYRATANDAFSTKDEVEQIIATAADAGVLTLEHRDQQAFIVRFSAWDRWQAAFRKARQRAGSKPHEQAGVTASHAKSRDVPYQTRQDKTTSEPDGSEQKTRSVPTSVPDNEQRTRSELPTRESAPLSFLLADLIEANGSRRPRVGKGWADAERLLLERDERDRGEAERLLRWCQGDEFWRGNVMSMAKFRQRYDQLRLKAPGAEVAAAAITVSEGARRMQERIDARRQEVAA